MRGSLSICNAAIAAGSQYVVLLCDTTRESLRRKGRAYNASHSARARARKRTLFIPYVYVFMVK